MFFWGPLLDQGLQKKVVWSTISLIGLDPDGCLVADLLKVHAINLKSWVQINKKGYFRAGW